MLLLALLVGVLLGFSTWLTFNKLPRRVKDFFIRFPLLFDGAVTLSNIFFITNISQSFLGIAAGAIAEFVTLGLFHKRSLKSKDP